MESQNIVKFITQNELQLLSTVVLFYTITVLAPKETQ